jgi:DNA-binding MarR family transcriptional regulator
MRKPFYTRETFDAQNSIGCLLRRLMNLTTPKAEACFADRDLAFSHWVTMVVIRDGLARTCADIARHMGYDSGATTRIVDHLEQRGLLSRTRSTADRRVVHLALTADGKRVAEAMAPRLMNFWNDALEGFSHAEAATLIALLTRLLAGVEKAQVAPAMAAAS